MTSRRTQPKNRAERVHYSQRSTYTTRPARPFQQHYAVSSKRSLITTGALVVVFAIMIGGIGWLSLQALGDTLPFAGADARSQGGQATKGQPVSTPKNEWKQGSVPYLYQQDPAWSNERYAENNFGESGCGPTCMAMVYAALTGATDKDPAAMAALSTSGGHASAEGTSWAFMTQGAAALGLHAEELSANEESIRRSIVSGKPVICSMGPGDFTEVGHFIVLTDIDHNGNLVVRDPNSPERSAKTWSFETVLSQSRNFWSYSLV